MQLGGTGVCPFHISVVWVGAGRWHRCLQVQERQGPDPAKRVPTGVFFPGVACAMFLVKGSAGSFPGCWRQAALLATHPLGHFLLLG